MEAVKHFLTTIDPCLSKAFEGVFDDPTGIYFPVFVLAGCKHVVNALSVEVEVGDARYVADRYNVDIFFSIYDKVKDASFIDAYQWSLEGRVEVEEGFETFLHTFPVETGQAKILSGVLDSLVNCEKYVSALIIGSSNDSYVIGGKTYIVVAEYLTSLGYEGVFYLYDPLEPTETRFEIGNFKFSVYNKKYDYNILHVGVTHVWDDSFHFVEDEREKDKTIRITRFTGFKEGVHQFVVVGSNGVYEMKTVNEHKDVKSAIGGGTYEQKGDKVSIFGTSMTHGPYSVEWFPSNFDIAPPTRASVKGKNLRLNKLYPAARIILKGLGQHMIGVEVPQRFYSGFEKREYIRIPTPHLTGNCALCSHVHYLRHNMRVYSNANLHEEIVRTYSKVIGKLCCSAKYQQKNHLRVAILAQARVQNQVDRAVELIARSTHLDKQTVRDMMRLLNHAGFIKTISKPIIPYKSFVIRVDNSRYKNADGYLYLVNKGLILTPDGKEMSNVASYLAIGKNPQKIYFSDIMAIDIVTAVKLLPRLSEIMSDEVDEEIMRNLPRGARKGVLYIGSSFVQAASVALMLQENAYVNAQYEREFASSYVGKFRVWTKINVALKRKQAIVK